MPDDAFITEINDNQIRYLDELKEFLRFQSISALSDHKGDMQKCAEWLRAQLESLNMRNVREYPTGDHPVVYGEWTKNEPRRKTVLIYGHYDVQPVDPLVLWNSPPFEPEVRDGKLYARGAADDKGQVYMHVKALDSMLATYGDLPVNVKLLIEGEEEIGSENLDRFIEEHKGLLACDVAVISDSSMFAPGVPSITYGLRGMTYLQIDVYGANSDLHSGSYGGAVRNPAETLARIIAGLKDDHGRITVPGFYDKVEPLRDSERGMWQKLPFDEAEYARELGVTDLYGEEGFSTLERVWARPTLEVNGIWGGFTGEGSKTVLPAEAHAKISCRLAPNQDPYEIADLLEDYVPKIAPSGVRVAVQKMHYGNPALVPMDDPVMEAASRAMERGFGKRPVFIREGGSIPVVATFDSVLGVPTILMGIGLPGENAHAPNEWLLLENFYGGIKSSAALLQELSAG